MISFVCLLIVRLSGSVTTISTGLYAVIVIEEVPW